MLELSGITYAPATAGAPILDGVAFHAQKGRPLLIAGASGSGKTSLLEIISGLASATSGSIRWNGSVMKRRQLRWLGHVRRMPFNRLPRRMLSSWVPSTRPSGAPRMTYGRGIRKALKKFNIDLDSWPELAADRDAWRVALYPGHH